MFSALGNLFTGKAGVDELAGPVGMVQMVSQTRSYGWWYYGFLTALICMNLAIVNMLPLPALDGGRIIFVLIGMITGKPVSEKAEGTVHFIGIALLLLLMVYVTFNDVTRIFG
jgi:Predicted membrane-associated Zn-dependent proteases 1